MRREFLKKLAFIPAFFGLAKIVKGEEKSTPVYTYDSKPELTLYPDKAIWNNATITENNLLFVIHTIQASYKIVTSGSMGILLLMDYIKIAKPKRQSEVIYGMLDSGEALEINKDTMMFSPGMRCRILLDSSLPARQVVFRF